MRAQMARNHVLRKKRGTYWRNAASQEGDIAVISTTYRSLAPLGTTKGVGTTTEVSSRAERGIQGQTSTRTTSWVTLAVFLNIAVAEQYFSSDSDTARSTSARFSFRPRTV